MPLDYSNVKSPCYREVVREFAPVQNSAVQGHAPALMFLICD